MHSHLVENGLILLGIIKGFSGNLVWRVDSTLNTITLSPVDSTQVGPTMIMLLPVSR